MDQQRCLFPHTIKPLNIKNNLKLIFRYEGCDLYNVPGIPFYIYMWIKYYIHFVPNNFFLLFICSLKRILYQEQTLYMRKNSYLETGERN